MSNGTDDIRWMRLALHLGTRGLGQTWPNPSVGCVIVKEGHVLGRGVTASGGRPHAEVQALTQAGKAAKGATAYVTLEPCAHQGQTPPCTTALIDAGIKRVVIGTGDPNPKVAGKGIQLLKDAGVDVMTGVEESAAISANLGFLNTITQDRPMVTLKLATSIDGKIATSTGDSQWITGPEARSYVHYLRATHDAVMVGSGTSLADDPTLTQRIYPNSDINPVRIIVDSKLSTPLKSNLVKTTPNHPLWMCHLSKAETKGWNSTKAELIECQTDGNHIDLTDMMSKLAGKGITRIFCEGGGKLAAGLLNAGLVDRLITMTGGVTIGAEGLNGLGALGLTKLPEAQKFSLQDMREFGGDVVQFWTRD